jgi:hypothetical protein
MCYSVAKMFHTGKAVHKAEYLTAPLPDLELDGKHTHALTHARTHTRHGNLRSK